MCLIVFWHIVLHGFGVFPYKDSAILLISTTISHCAVPCFVMLSGWFGIRPSLRGVFRLVSMILFYSVFLYLLSLFLGWRSFSWQGFASSFFPLFNDRWWFINAYLALYLTASFLNRFLRESDSHSIWIQIGLLFFISFWINHKIGSPGRQLPLFWLFYLIGNRLKNSSSSPALEFLRMNSGKFLTLLLLTVSLAGWICCTVNAGFHLFLPLFFSYNGVGNICLDIVVMLVFLGRRFGRCKDTDSSLKTPWSSSFVNFCAAGVFPAYLLHENEYVSVAFYGLLKPFMNTPARAFAVALFGAPVLLAVLICIDAMLRPCHALIARFGEKGATKFVECVYRKFLRFDDDKDRRGIG